MLQLAIFNKGLAMTFKKGESGNAKGRRKGVKTNAVKLKEAMPSAIDTLVDAANSGDVTAAAAILDRVWPVGSASQ
jgi:hypothetical protein